MTPADELEQRMTRWLALRDERHARGELRASRDELGAFEQFQEALDSLTPDARTTALERVSRLSTLCRCGHPEGHHVSGSHCFHVVGCATACECREWTPVERDSVR